MGKRHDPLTPGTSEKDIIKSEIRDTRAEMTETLEAMHGKLNPAVLKEQVIDQFHHAKDAVKGELTDDFERVRNYVRNEVKQQVADAKESLAAEYAGAKAALREATVGKVGHMMRTASDTVKGAGSSLLDIIRENPIPVLLTGSGIVWLFLNARARRQSSLEEGNNPTLAEFEDGTGEGILERGREALTHGAGTLREKAGQLSSRALETATHVKDRTRETVRDLASGARVQARRVEERFSHTMEENPLTVGMVALALGAVAGLLIPGSRKEDALMGTARDRVVEKIEETAHSALGQVQRTVQSGLEDSPSRH